MLTVSSKYTLSNWMWGIFTFGLLVLVIPLVLLSQLPWPVFLESTILVLLSVAYSGLRLALLAVEGRQKLMSLTFWIFAYIWMGIAPLAQLATGEFGWGGIYSDKILGKAVFVVILGFISYDVGSRFGTSRFLRIEGTFVPHGLSLSRKRIFLLGPLTIAISLMAMVKMGFVPTFQTRADFGSEALSGFSDSGAATFWFTLLRVPPFIALLLTWWAWLNRKSLGVKPEQYGWLVTLVVVLFALNVAVNNPISAPRYFAGTVILSLLFVGLRWNERHSFGVWVVSLVAMLLAVFPYADYFRSEYEMENTRIEPIASTLSTGDYDAFQQLTNTLVFVSAEGVSYGWQLLGVLLFWVPRSVWPGKPVDTGDLIAQFSGYSYTNLSSPLWAEGYINAGLIGVVVAFFAYGALTSRLQNTYLDFTHSQPSLTNVLVPILAAYQIFLLRGSLLSTFAYLAPMLFFIILAARRRLPSASEETPGSKARATDSGLLGLEGLPKSSAKIR